MNIPKMPGIYLLRNKINGKCYIGETINLWRRYRQYKWTKKSAKELIGKMILKYGFDNFEFQILKLFNHKNKTILWIWENYFINQYKSMIEHNGYNCKLWGYGTWGRKLSKQSKLKISIANSGKNNGMYGKTHSDEYKQRRSQINKTNHPYKGKLVKQIDPKTNKVIKIWKNSRVASIAISGKPSSHIAEVCNKKIYEGYLVKTWKGFKWEYVEKM